MKTSLYITTSLLVLLIGYYFGKVELFSPLAVTSPIDPHAATSAPPFESETVIKTNHNSESVSKSDPRLTEFLALPDTQGKFELALENLEELYKNDPEEISPEDIFFYSHQIKFIIDWSKPDQGKMEDLAFKLNRLNSNEFKEDIFEYFVQSGLMKENELAVIINQ